MLQDNDYPYGSHDQNKQMTTVDLAAIITYKHNTWENKTGGMVSPADVQAFMDK